MSKCKAMACEREVKAKGLCHVHLKEEMKPRDYSKRTFGNGWGSEWQSWQKRMNLERSWKKEAVEHDRHARSRRKRTNAIDMATPAWLSDKQLALIKGMYEEARRLSKEKGERYEVDHVVPLHSPVVCGLHVPWNMRVISKEENNRKGNRSFQEAMNAEDID